MNFVAFRIYGAFFSKTEDFSSEDEDFQHAMQVLLYAVPMYNRKLFIYVTLSDGLILFILG